MACFPIDEQAMSKAIYICSRHRQMAQGDEIRIREICEKLTPDILGSSAPHRILVTGKVAFGVVNDSPCVVQKDESLLLGLLYETTATWDEPHSGSPDGSYAMFRSSRDHCEIVSDPAASRTIWYYFDDELFVASTSQRAIVMFLGSFMFDERVIPWMLSTGSLGPEHSWDRRLRRLGPDSSLLLDKNSWKVSKTQAAIEFAEIQRTPGQHQELLTEAIRTTIGSLEHLSLDMWALPLSGGYDSRALLCFLSQLEHFAGKLNTFTWGLKASITEKGNDAYVAKSLAQHLGVPHRYYHTDKSEEPIEIILDRFIACGEGRIDHLSGYMDGCQLWKSLFQSGVKGVLRGDQGFSRRLVSSQHGVRESIGCALCQDFSNLEYVLKEFELAPQVFPGDFEMKDHESLPQWRDRLYHAYRLPTVLAALADLRLSFVEQANPLLSRRILQRVRALPDVLRTDKALFKAVVAQVGPGIPYARSGATAASGRILARPDVVQVLKARIDMASTKDLLGGNFAHYILNGIRTSSPGASEKRTSRHPLRKKIVPRFVINKLRGLKSRPSVDGNVLAFRAFLIVRMHEMLSEDVKGLGIHGTAFRPPLNPAP